MIAPFDAAARTYLDAGWQPIPVLGKSIPAKGTTGYEGTVSREKVEAWLAADMQVRAEAGRGVRVDNIGVRHRLTVAIDVDQGYGDKDGVTQLAEYAQRHELPPLPATWSSTARGPETGSRQYLYRIPDDVPLRTKPCKSVEVCCWHHRFTVVWPSIHPTVGEPYRWYQPSGEGVPPTWGEPVDRVPRVDELPELPEAWFKALRGGVANADRSVVTVSAPELLATFPDGEPDAYVRTLIEMWSDENVHVGHDEAKNALIHAFLLGREGHRGVPELYRVIVDRFTAYVAVARPKEAEREARSLIEACATIAQQKPIGPVVFGRMPTPAEFMAGAQAAPEAVDDDPNRATDEEIRTFLDTYTRFTRPDMLGRRIAWMRTDPPARLSRHAYALVRDVLAGHYPANKALEAIAGAYAHHGGTDPAAPRQILASALGAVLTRKVGAR